MIKILLIASLFPLPLLATTLEGNGVAECKFFNSQNECRASAEQSAQESLASQLYVKVESQTDTKLDNQGGNLFNFSAKTQTNIKLIGAELSCNRSKYKGGRYDCTAKMQATRSAKLYQVEINRIAEVIKSNYKVLEKSLPATKISQLNTLLNDLQTFEKLSLVYNLLQPNGTLPDLATNAPLLQQQLNQIQQQPNSLEQLAQLVAQELSTSKSQSPGRTNVFIAPPQSIGSQEVTPFSSIFYQMLKAQVPNNKEVTSIEQADYRLSSIYQTNATHMDITFILTDKQGNNIFTRVWQLQSEVYAKWRTKPQLLDFDKLLHQGYVVNTKFKVDVQTNKGSRNILFVEGETAKVLVKLNRSGYIYILGHSKNDELEQSYLLELTDEAAPYAFELYISPENTNKWLDISDGGFEISAPFGMDSLEVFASETSFIKNKALPSVTYDGDYHIVSKNLKQAVVLTRGLKKKKSKKSQTAEAVIMMTTTSKLH